MPYIPKVDRIRMGFIIGEAQTTIDSGGISNGDLNYLFSRLAEMYIKYHGLSYNTGSDVIKAFECAKLEFYRRILAPYEDTKLTQNGDIY